MAGEIPVYCAHDEIVDIMKVIPNPKNPNTHGERQIDILSQVIKAQGWRKPITVSKRSGFVVAGHGRLQAALLLKTDKVPVDYQYYATEAEEYADLVADNRIAELSEIDDKLLCSILEEIKEFEDFNFELTGYTDCDIDRILENMDVLDFGEDTEVVDDDYEVELPEESKAKYGDIYQLGNHRLMCGDSTKIEDVEKLIDGKKASLYLSDPPYGINIVGEDGKVGAEFGIVKKGTYITVKGDETTETAKKNYNIVSKITNNQIIFGGNYFTDFLPFSDGWIIWDKRCDSGIKNTFADGEMAWCNFHTPVRIYRQLWNGMIREGESSKRVHPTQKPVRLMCEILKDFSEERDIVLDCFGGSGTILIACEQLNRFCYMMEYEPKYIDVIIDRWEKFTGEKAVLLNAV